MEYYFFFFAASTWQFVRESRKLNSIIKGRNTSQLFTKIVSIRIRKQLRVKVMNIVDYTARGIFFV